MGLDPPTRGGIEVIWERYAAGGSVEKVTTGEGAEAVRWDESTGEGEDTEEGEDIGKAAGLLLLKGCGVGEEQEAGNPPLA